eukprot:759279-Hanusia_phi.AAC.3
MGDLSSIRFSPGRFRVLTGTRVSGDPRSQRQCGFQVHSSQSRLTLIGHHHVRSRFGIDRVSMAARGRADATGNGPGRPPRPARPGPRPGRTGALSAGVLD